jgi:dCMP deaminase
MRPTKHEWFMEVARVTAKRSTCVRRNVGCVIVDKEGYILSTGYNGVPKNFIHCIDKACNGSKSKSGFNLDACKALHAEQNAIARLKEPFNAEVLYVTTSPCIACTKLILATSIKTIIYDVEYPNNGKDLWLEAKRIWTKL